jgi:hypothetical protein
MASQSTSLRAVHLHCALLAATAIVFLWPAGWTESLVGLTVNSQGAASWEMVTCWLAMLIDPRRSFGSVLEATENDTFPSPCPDELPSWIQVLEGDALHWHSRFVETASVPLPPEAENVEGLALALTGHLIVEGPVTL